MRFLPASFLSFSLTRGRHRPRAPRPGSRVWADPRPPRATEHPAFRVGPESRCLPDARHVGEPSGSEQEKRHPPWSPCSSVAATRRPKCAARTGCTRPWARRGASAEAGDAGRTPRPAGRFLLPVSGRTGRGKVCTTLSWATRPTPTPRLALGRAFERFRLKLSQASLLLCGTKRWGGRKVFDCFAPSTTLMAVGPSRTNVQTRLSFPSVWFLGLKAPDVKLGGGLARDSHATFSS